MGLAALAGRTAAYIASDLSASVSAALFGGGSCSIPYASLEPFGSTVAYGAGSTAVFIGFSATGVGAR